MSDWRDTNANAIPSGSIQQITIRSGLGVETTHAITPGTILLLPSAVAPTSDPHFTITSIVGTAHCGGDTQPHANDAIMEWFFGTWYDRDYDGESDAGDAASQSVWSYLHGTVFQIKPADVVGGVKGWSGQAIGADAGTPGELLPAGATIPLYMANGRQAFLLLDVWRTGCFEGADVGLGRGDFHPDWTNLHPETAPGSGIGASINRAWDRGVHTLTYASVYGSPLGVTKAGGLAGIKTKAVVEIRVNVKPATPVAA